MINLPSTPLTVEKRLNRLEAENQGLREENRKTRRRSRYIQGGLGLLVVILLTLGAAQSRDGDFETLTCKHFVFQDQDGRKRIEMTAEKDGQIGQNFFDKNGKGRIILVIPANGDAQQTISDQNSHWRFATCVASNGLAVQMLCDQRYILRAALAANPDGSVNQTFGDASGQVQMILPGEDFTDVPASSSVPASEPGSRFVPIPAPAYAPAPAAPAPALVAPAPVPPAPVPRG